MDTKKLKKITDEVKSWKLSSEGMRGLTTQRILTWRAEHYVPGLFKGCTCNSCILHKTFRALENAAGQLQYELNEQLKQEAAEKAAAED